MRLVWTLVKVVVGLAIIVPITVVALGAAVGVLAVVLGLAALALKLAILALIAVGCVRLVARLFRGPTPARERPVARELRAADPHYEAAMRELDIELGELPRRS
jgi:hypothetical protein